MRRIRIYESAFRSHCKPFCNGGKGGEGWGGVDVGARVGVVCMYPFRDCVCNDFLSVF